MGTLSETQVRIAALEAALAERIVVLDGSWGVLIQGAGLAEADFRGARFVDWEQDLSGNADILNLTKPGFVSDIHRRYLEAGADITTTNTFTATRISQSEYGLGELAEEINREGARLAREAADEAAATDERGPRWVAGSLGPTNRTLSISPDASDPAARAVTFDELRVAYFESARGLLDGGVDVLLLETIFDTLNAKAALVGIDELFEERGSAVPLWISATIVDQSGRTLSGQTIEAFWTSVRHARPTIVGLNCSLGSPELRPYVAEMARIADAPVAAFPNAGLPNEFGLYDETPEFMADEVRRWAEDGLVNIVGSCCGSTPAHTRAIADTVRGLAPRPVPPPPHRRLRLSGLEAVEVGA